MQHRYGPADLGSCREYSPWPRQQAKRIHAWPPASNSTLRCEKGVGVEVAEDTAREITLTRTADATR